MMNPQRLKHLSGLTIQTFTGLFGLRPSNRSMDSQTPIKTGSATTFYAPVADV
jgi:hypothetical protein